MHLIVKEDLEFITATGIHWDKLEGRNILVTGANGFLPAYMIETILFLNEHRFKKKAKIFALARNKERVQKRFSGYRGNKNIVFIIQDVCAPLKIHKKMDFIIHAASQASPKFYGSDPAGTISANTLGTANLLALAAKHKSQGFLFFSSGEVYGEVAVDQVPIREDTYGLVDPMLLRSCYAEGKRAGENMCVSWSHQYGIPVKIIRPFHTYGPGMRLDDGRVFADFVCDVVAGRDIIMKSDGSAVRAFCYLADAVAGFFTVLLEGSSAQAYNVGNDEGISIAGLAKILVDLRPEKHLKVIQRESDCIGGYIKSRIPVSVPDTTKIRRLGWKPFYSIKEGFGRTVRSFESE
ncbi:MAG: NAD-dependent epimerase/dehydratase family protein [Candidatus Omnitrophica bacterium]|nr:NAD-dependent epimerase/dehydratase family protein [Candidatus Omnitrophota bacterium]